MSNRPSGGDGGDSGDGGKGRKRRVSAGIVAAAVVMAILIVGAGVLVFAGPLNVGAPSPAVNLSATTTRNASSSSSTTIARVVNATLSTSANGVAAQGQSQSINLTAEAPPEVASVMLDASPGAQHALFYEAKQQGYYAEQGLQVNIVPGTGSAATIGSVAAGRVEFGMADATTAVTAISGGAGIQIIGVITQTQPFAVFYLRSSGISSPSALQGKTYCSSTAAGDHVVFPAFAKSAGINTTTIKFMNFNPPFYSLLVSGTCGFTTGALYDLGGYQAAANESGLPAGSIQYMTYSSVGVNPYGFVLIANNNVVKTDPNLVERFVNATYQGEQYVLGNQGPTLAYMTGIIPGGSMAVQSLQLSTFVNASMPLMNSPSYKQTDARTLGIINSTLMNQTASNTVKYLNAEPIPASQAYYSSSFLTCTKSECG
jgi:ABC-type nitrate/sulfonate/bicarbonate transport system substrate-binding protein